jgi:MFS family permease
MLNNQRSAGYEWKIVTLLALLHGTLGLDRLVIVYLFPILMPEFGLNNTQAGALTAVLALTWAVAAWVMGSLSDRVGRKKVLLPSAIFFSLMSWVTGVAKSYGSLLVIRGLMGIGEGGVFSTSAATIGEESTPKRRGLNLGIHQSFFPGIGIGLGAIIATQLATKFGWRPVFFIVGIPGLVLAAIIAYVMKEPLSFTRKAENNPAKETDVQHGEKTGMFAALKYRNVWVSTLVSCLFMNWLFVFAAFAVLFLTQVRGLSLPTAGIVLSAWGFGGFIGMIGIGAVSDHLGRRPVMIVSAVITGISVIWFALAGSNPATLFCILFIGAIFGWGTYPIFLALSTTESVPSKLAGSAVGIPTSIGEIFGAMVMPIIAGSLADKFGLIYPMYLAGIAPIVAAVVSFLYIETAPRVLARRNKTNEVDGVAA